MYQEIQRVASISSTTVVIVELRNTHDIVFLTLARITANLVA
jgi:hypothetical protein